jgi:hypothetical protein
MMRIFGVFILFSLIFLSASDILAQSTSELEMSYNNSKKNLVKETNILDSLKILLNEKANQIDYEKNKKDADKNKIVELMSSSVIISDKYELQQRKVRQLENTVDSLGKKLSNRYTSTIDSLQSLKNSGDFSGDRDKLDSEVLLNLEKKLELVPKISLLSFDPAELLKINPDKNKDSLGNAIYMEYLQSAYDELYNHLANVDEQYTEIKNIILLQKKTEKFLKETEFEGGLRTERSASDRSSTNENRSSVFTDQTNFSGETRIIEQLHGYTLLLNQLSLDLSSGKKLSLQVESMDGNSSLSLKQYKKMLEELREKLQEYKLVLSNKINVYKR